ncbi:Eco57I restriction-modification methylase domain-containing protein [Bradyrhizobium diazoefficiens]|uniref:Eco57I restriction-modification methylase domain-containing protein n=1 Tax=Bradyrhizobium diazoefficiens TaxID=1355477 RepID=UPI00272AA5D7|nr:N-6 DNA methylase [Bradyrhizobium diazoefficiens]WLA61408.1 N-6 DNA methylase [Bradyrhizobium diazoefficiens]
MVAQIAHLLARDAAPERIRALIRTTISEIEGKFTTIDRLQARTRLTITLSLLEGSVQQASPRFGRLTAILRDELNKLDVDDRHYWISTFYTLLMSTSARREKATYFTPPAIVRHLIGQAEKADLDLRTARVIDPAAGGAAFVSSLAGRMTELGCSSADIKSRISGIEIEPHLALLGEALVRDRLGSLRSKSRLIRTGDSLTFNEVAKYDAVFVNPPYGRILGLKNEIPAEWRAFSAPGHVNRYALFMDLAFRMAKPGGLVGTVTPSSFISGPLFDKLRENIRTRTDVVRIDVLERKDVFHDVQQDACVAIFRMKSVARTGAKSLAPKVGRLDRNWKFAEDGAVTTADARLTAPWILPGEDSAFECCLARLADYGVQPKAGYFVWNREQDRLLRGKKTGSAFPLFWGTNIKPGKPCLPRSKDGRSVDFVAFKEDNSGIIRKPSILLQRTTNSKQQRRLIAAAVPRKVLKKYKGFVGENHTIALVPEGRANLSLLVRLLNTDAVDKRFRQVGGTSSISISALRNLPLPSPEHLRTALQKSDDFEGAVELAYSMSALAASKRRAA